MSIQKEVSNKQEREVADKLGGKLTIASGASKFSGGDVETKYALIECKTVTSEKTSFSIKSEWLSKIAEQCFEQGKIIPALAFRFKPDGKDYIVIDSDIFNNMLHIYEKILEGSEENG